MILGTQYTHPVSVTPPTPMNGIWWNFHRIRDTYSHYAPSIKFIWRSKDACPVNRGMEVPIHRVLLTVFFLVLIVHLPFLKRGVGGWWNRFEKRKKNKINVPNFGKKYSAIEINKNDDFIFSPQLNAEQVMLTLPEHLIVGVHIASVSLLCMKSCFPSLQFLCVFCFYSVRYIVYVGSLFFMCSRLDHVLGFWRINLNHPTADVSVFFADI